MYPNYPVCIELERDTGVLRTDNILPQAERTPHVCFLNFCRNISHKMIKYIIHTFSQNASKKLNSCYFLLHMALDQGISRITNSGFCKLNQFATKRACTNWLKKMNFNFYKLKKLHKI